MSSGDEQVGALVFHARRNRTLLMLRVLMFFFIFFFIRLTLMDEKKGDRKTFSSDK